MWIYVWCMCVCVCRCTCILQRPEQDIGIFLSNFPPSSFGQGFTMNLEVGWQPASPRDICPCPLQYWLPGGRAQLLHTCQELELGSLCLQGRCSYPLHCLPSPKVALFPVSPGVPGHPLKSQKLKLPHRELWASVCLWKLPSGA